MIAWLRDTLAAPRRLRQLGERHDELRQRLQLGKLFAAHELAQAKAQAEHYRARLRYFADQTRRIEELEAAIEKLRAENGENYRRYVRVQHALDQYRNRPYGGCP